MSYRAVEAMQVAVNAIVVTTTAALLYLPGPATERAGRDAWLAVLLGAALGAAFARWVWAAYLLPERAPGAPAARLGWVARPLGLAFAAYAAYLAVLQVAQVATVMTTVLPEMPIAVFAAGTVLTGWIVAAYGREALFRAGQLLFPLMVLASVVNLAFALTGNVDPRELLPVLEYGPGPVLSGVPLAFAFASEVVAMAAAGGAVRDPRSLGRLLPLATLLSGLLLAAYTAGAVAVLGTHEVVRSTFPVLALTRQVRVSLFLSRVEILTLFAWLTGAFIKQALLLWAVGEGLVRGLGLPPRRQSAVAAAVGAMVALLGVVAFDDAPTLFAHVADVFPVVATAAGVALVMAGSLLALPGAGGRGPGAPPGRRPTLRGRRAAALLLLLAPLAGGCFGRVEPEQAAVATVLGLDRSPGGGVAVTVEVVGAPAGGPMEEAGGVAQRLLRAEGRSLLDAQRRLELEAAREVLWSHVNVVVVGESLAREGLWPVLDALTRRYTFRRNAFVFVSEGDAGDLLQRLAPVFHAPRLVAFQRAILRPSARVGPATDLNAFLRTLGHEGEDPYLPVVAVSPPHSAEPSLRRAALFRHDRLVTLLDERATLGLYWLAGRQEVERLQWPCPGRPGVRGLGVTAVRSQVRRSVGADRDGPWAQAHVRIEADVEEWQCPTTLSPATLDEAERAAADWVGGEAAALLAEARRLGVDPVGLGAALRRADPAAWAAVRDRWREVLRRLPVAVEVDVEIRRTGLTLQPP